jgi:hypothetical protein
MAVVPFGQTLLLVWVWAQEPDMPVESGTLPVSVSLREVCPGEPVEVSVPAEGARGRATWINQAPGPKQVLQFEGNPGPRLVRASDGAGETGRRIVTVRSCPEGEFPIIHARPSPFRRFDVELTVANPAPGADKTPSLYVWDFGDATPSVETSVPYVVHDYGRRLELGRTDANVDVSVRLPTGKIGRRTVALAGLGFSSPRVRSELRSGRLSFAMEAEPRARVITAVLEEQYCDPARRSRYSVASLTPDRALKGSPVPAFPGMVEFLVPPNEEFVGTLALPQSAERSLAIPSGAKSGAPAPDATCSLATHFIGKSTDDDVPIHSVKTVELLANPFATASVKAGSEEAKLLEEITSWGLVRRKNEVSPEEIHALSLMKAIVHKPGKGWDVYKRYGQPGSVLNVPKPNCPGPAPSPKHKCKPTGEWRRVAGYVANANKGDVLW